jgi:uncharacterized protein (DUF885 family)
MLPLSPGRWAALFALLLATTAGGLAQNAAPAEVSAGELRDFVSLYQTDRNGVSRFYDLPWSEARFTRLEALFNDWQRRLEAVEFDTLNQQGRIDYLLLRSEIRAELSRLALDRRRLIEMDELLSFRGPLQVLEQARWKMEPVDGQAAATKVSALAEQVKKLQKRVEKGRKAKAEARTKEPEKAKGDDSARASPSDALPASAEHDKPESKNEDGAPIKVSPSLAKRTASAVTDLRGTLKNWFSFYDGYQPDFSWWLKKPHEDASKALEDFSKYLREEIAGLKGKDEDPLIGDPIGAETLAQDIANEFLPYSAEELIAIGEKEFAWCEREMKRAAKEMGLGEDWKAALAKVKSLYVPPGQQDSLVADLAREAIRFVKAKDLVTVPPLCEETWRLTMVSPEGQKTLPFAAYGGQNIMVAYAKDEMKHDDKLMAMRGNNRPFTRIVTAHELIPGHHLQAFASARNRPYRSLFSTPFFVEGWALYWELTLWKEGFAQSPEDRIGMLFWRMHRCSRIIVSLKYHLNQMKPSEMVDFLVERVGHERFGATGEVRRFIGGSYSPLYQCGYMIGGLQLRALREEMVGKLSDRQFNDTVLTYHSMPIELIRAGMLNLPLTRETQSSWRFADGNSGAN